jgi:hypothetical protein
VTTDTDLAAQILQHMRTMGRCSNQQSAVAWMAQAYNLLDAAARLIEQPKVFVVPGTYGERTYTVARTAGNVQLPEPGFYKAPPVWLQGHTTVYGDRYQNRAWTGRDTRQLEKENARRAAQGLSTKSK